MSTCSKEGIYPNLAFSLVTSLNLFLWWPKYIRYPLSLCNHTVRLVRLIPSLFSLIFTRYWLYNSTVISFLIIFRGPLTTDKTHSRTFLVRHLIILISLTNHFYSILWNCADMRCRSLWPCHGQFLGLLAPLFPFTNLT